MGFTVTLNTLHTIAKQHRQEHFSMVQQHLGILMLTPGYIVISVLCPDSLINSQNLEPTNKSYKNF